MTADLAAWQAELADRIQPMLEAAMLAAAGSRPDGEIAGIGISTDADATSVVAFANSRQNLDAMVADEPEFALDSKWHIGEWDLDVTGSGAPDQLEPLRAELEQAKPSADASTGTAGFAVPGMQEFRHAVWGAIAAAMAASAAEGFFDRWPTAAHVFMPLDADVDEQQLADWSAPLNDAEGVAELRAFLQLD
ncbi:DUF4303 domain-containing protein [Agrococcus sp. BE272]|uniref:DUF4303 domain-containing protein n=1 Tax=Agrococcus sp. BE272 TaxID=2817727 RepID=UPI00285869AC|nr:DUF4303 domain-containing protein [Agrococcus sp. BE272]MDR7233941.1 hypothetical protein [Agrococcus sp. BE272]